MAFELAMRWQLSGLGGRSDADGTNRVDADPSLQVRCDGFSESPGGEMYRPTVVAASARTTEVAAGGHCERNN